MNSPYFFTSARLGFRNWVEADKAPYRAMNSDPDVMEYFPNPFNQEESDASFERNQTHISANKFGYFAVDILETNTFIGFIGIMSQNYQTDYSPFVDIGWRLAAAYWGKGYGTEGARACLDYGFKTIGLKEIYCVTTWNNLPSMAVAKKIGMHKIDEFVHPKLEAKSPLQPMHMFRLNR